MVMNMYSDIDDEWSFTETGDLKINYNYRQSIKHRLLCPLHYLNIYYENYGSNLYQQLGERYNEEIVFEEVSNTLRQDVNIYNYEINSIDFINGELILNLTINGDNVWFSYHIYDEMNEFITVDSEIFYDENWKLKVILNINSSEYIFIKNLNEIYGEIETVSYMNCYRENEIINIELIINGIKTTLNMDLNGNLEKRNSKIVYDYYRDGYFILSENDVPISNALVLYRDYLGAWEYSENSDENGFLTGNVLREAGVIDSWYDIIFNGNELYNEYVYEKREVALL